MKSRSFISLFMLMFVLIMSNAVWAAPTAVEITGEIERLTLDDPTNVYSGGVMIVGGTQVILPKNLLIDLPANRLSLQQIFTQAPAACVALNESGLAKADLCNASGTGGFATLSAVHTNAGNVIAGDVLLDKGKDTASGVVSYINYTEGYFRVNGIPGDATTGVMVRLNDPTSRHTIQSGAGCAGGPNCSADPRFTLDPDNYVITFSTGYPVCIPSTVSRNFPGLPALPAGGIAAVPAGATQSDASGNGDRTCPSTNRTPGLVVEPPVNDSRVFAPLMVGDSILAEGNFEAVNGTRFLSAHTMRVNKALATKNVAGQPDYMFLEEVFMEAPGFQNQRARMLVIGFATLAPTDVDFWTIHRDPTTNAIHEFPLASIGGCDIANGVGLGGGQCSSQGLIGAGANIFRIRYDVDFILAAANDPKFPGGATAKLNPCMHLQASPRFTISNPGICSNGGVTLANNFGIMSPIPHEIQARTGHSLDAPAGSLVTLDINGAAATNGQYLFPFGINLGGVETADFLEIDVNLLSTPRIFEGIPWNLDRRLSPSGCLKAGGCEGTPQPLDPFPYTGLDPRTQADFAGAGGAGPTPKGVYNDPNFTASALSNASNRVFSYVSAAANNFNGNTTLLPCATGVFPANCPADPALIAIVPTPVLNIFPPVVDEDTASTAVGVPVIINVLANDTAVFGSIDPTSVQIASNPASGTLTVNPTTGAITYTPTPSFTVATATFTYTVANNFGSRSLPGTVTVTIFGPPSIAPTPIAPKGTGILTTAAFSFTPVAGATGYKIYNENLAGVGAFIDITPTQAGCTSETGTCNFTPATPFTSSTTYGWLVAAVNAAGNGPFSAISNFTTVTVVTPTVPAAPTAISPLGPNALSTAPFIFGAVADATAYKIYYENNSGVGSFIDVTPAQAGCVSGTGACTFTPTTPFTAITTYGWLVSASNAAGAGPWSATLNFVTAPATPAAPTALTPTGTGVATNAPFTFSAVSGATGYVIYSENLAGVGGFVSVSALQAGCPTGTGTCSYTPATPFTAATTYGWLVSATNLNVQGPYSATLNFVTQ